MITFVPLEVEDSEGKELIINFEFVKLTIVVFLQLFAERQLLVHRRHLGLQETMAIVVVIVIVMVTMIVIMTMIMMLIMMVIMRMIMTVIMMVIMMVK